MIGFIYKNDIFMVKDYTFMYELFCRKNHLKDPVKDRQNRIVCIVKMETLVMRRIQLLMINPFVVI